MNTATANCEENDFVLLGFGMPIVDGLFYYKDDPRTGEEIKSKLPFHMKETDTKAYEIYDQVMNSELVYRSLGGSTLNALRIANHIIKSQGHKVAFLGSIGNDDYGNFIKKSLLQEALAFHSQEILGERTATTIVLVEKKERYLFTDLGGSKKYSLNFLEHHLPLMKKSKIVVTDAYLIGARKDIYDLLFKSLVNEDVTLALGFGTHEMLRDYSESFIDILPYVDIMFMNKHELAMWKIIQAKTELSDKEFFENVSMEKINKKKNLVIVVTRGALDTIVFNYDFTNNKSDLLSVPVPDVPKSDIVDLNGAGDAFTGGYLAGFVLNHNVLGCVKIGNLVATEVIQLKGFQVPVNLKYKDMIDELYPEHPEDL